MGTTNRCGHVLNDEDVLKMRLTPGLALYDTETVSVV